MEDDNYQAVAAFAAQNIGHRVAFEFRARGTRTWLRGGGVVNDDGEIVCEGAPGDYPLTIAFL